jgi:type IV pilus assembly protein PilY1
MKTFRIFGFFLMLSLLGSSFFARADDIDIYSDNSATMGVPNVLLVLDNAANFEAAAGNCTYVDGTAPTLNGKAGGIEQCAIYNVVSGLPDGAVNLGLMVYNANNIHDINNANCGGSDGGCLTQPLALMTGTAKSNFLAWIKTWKTSGGAGDGYIKANGEATAATMQEAWAYYAGATGLSGRSYAGIQPPSGCQKNFVIFIGNAFTAAGSPGDGGSASPQAALASAPGVTTAQRTNITIPSGSYGTSSFSCGNYTMGNHTESSGLYADEWARYMFQTDIYGGTDGQQGITTYTVGLLGSSCKPDFPALLSSMAKYGGGKYFATSNYSEISTAILKILNEVQAVNSVFSSASLPVSVNAQGTYLNQIFLGMFRPDASASPRWLGNLKQYQFILEYPDPSNPDPNKATLRLGDSTGAPAISSAGTGFITPTAISYWTKKDTAAAPDSTGGFFLKDPHGAGGAFDSPDGELVEKGGGAQQLRTGNLAADFVSTPGTSSNPRRLYTYCPGGVSCIAALTDSSNAFAVGNTNIPASAFGGAANVPIRSIVRTGTTALVTTSGNHGFSVGTTVTISNANPSDYNVTQAITAPLTANTFTITGLGDYPATPSQGAYTISSVGPSQASVSSMARSTSTSGGNNSETVTVTTSSPHSFAAGSTVTIAGATPSNYSGNFTIALPGTSSCPAATCFTYSTPVYPKTPATNTYNAVISPYSVTISSIVTVGSNATVTTSTAHGFHVGQTVTITSPNNKYNGTQVVASVVSSTSFTFGGINGNPADCVSPCTSTSVMPLATAVTLASLTRSGTTDATTATATGATAGWFGNAIGDTYRVNVATSGSSGNEAAYVVSNATLTCANVSCTTFTYPVTVTPSATIAGTITASPPATSTAAIAAGNITRSGTTATAAGVTANTFVNGQRVNIAVSGSGFANESAYVGTWTISCTAPCTTLTFGPVTLTPTTPATGSNMQAYSGSTPPDRDTLIKWVRGQDNFGDELGPGGTVTVRPSVHGDVLHSRPVVVNYGDSRGLVVFYGANDGVFSAVNGSQTGNIGAVPPGGELWGLVLPEFFGKLNRQRINSPELKMPSTLLPDAQPKDYFVDGSPGVYQKLKTDGTVDKAYLYLIMRRGGRFIYAMDVSDPTQPQVMWKITASDADFQELGQTWARPRLTLVKGYTNPVLVFGAGYDPAEDAQPPGTDTMGRGIFVVDAVTGVRVWSAAYTAASASCSGTSTQAACAVPDMKWAIPADVTFLDRDNDGKTDRFYAADVGGNVWRVDLESTAGNTPDHWKVSKFAALGCNSGICASGTTPRKFFFPPNVVSVGALGLASSYDDVMLGSGDREHPLISAATGSSYGVANRFYVLKDTVTGKEFGSTAALTESALFDATTTSYNGTLSGFYTTLATGEKTVNASTTTKGTTFFGTNRPVAPSANSCTSNLGVAKGYALNPFTGTFNSTIYDGGGLPPTPITGIVNITMGDGSTVQKEFCVGCGGGTGGDSKSALGAGDLDTKVQKNLRRTYWFKK